MTMSQPTRPPDGASRVNFTATLWRAALDIAFPIRCLGCGRAGRFICAGCVDLLPKLSDPFCRICANPGVRGVCSWCRDKNPAVDEIRAPYLYVRRSPIYRAITMLKYGGIRSLAPELADLLAAFLNTHRIGFDVIIPVPSHTSRVRRRGYSQATLIASALGERMRVPVDDRSLTRVRSAPSQLATESREDRWTNVEGGFEASALHPGLTVLLVDDLVTTGSTASACAHSLKQADAAKVVGLSVARSPQSYKDTLADRGNR